MHHDHQFVNVTKIYTILKRKKRKEERNSIWLLYMRKEID